MNEQQLLALKNDMMLQEEGIVTILLGVDYDRTMRRVFLEAVREGGNVGVIAGSVMIETEDSAGPDTYSQKFFGAAVMRRGSPISEAMKENEKLVAAILRTELFQDHALAKHTLLSLGATKVRYFGAAGVTMVYDCSNHAVQIASVGWDINAVKCVVCYPEISTYTEHEPTEIAKYFPGAMDELGNIIEFTELRREGWLIHAVKELEAAARRMN